MGKENVYGKLGRVSEKERELIASLKEMGLTDEQIVIAIEKTRATYRKSVNRSAIGKIISHIAGLHRLTGVPVEKITSVIGTIEKTEISIIPVHRKNGDTFYVPLSKYSERDTTPEDLVKLVREYMGKQSKE